MNALLSAIGRRPLGIKGSPCQAEPNQSPPPPDPHWDPVRRPPPRRSPSRLLDMDRPHFNPFEPAIAQHTLPPAPAPYTSFVDLERVLQLALTMTPIGISPPQFFRHRLRPFQSNRF
jgi:hypothetical protein